MASRRQDVSVLPPGIARSGHRVAMLTNSGCQTLPVNRRINCAGQQVAGADYAYQQPANSPKFYHHHRRQHPHQQQKQRNVVSDAIGSGGRFNSLSLPRRDVIVTCHETGNGNSRSAVATGSPPTAGSGGRRRPRLKPAVSDLDIVGGSSHLSPRGGATGDMRHPEAATHIGGITSTSLLALPDTSV